MTGSIHFIIRHRSVGLTEEEKIEQAQLRKEYIATIKMNLRISWITFDIKEADGPLRILVRNMEEKQAIRKQIFAARKACTDQQIEDLSRMITKRVAALPEFCQAERIMAYADYNHEVMTGFLIEEAWKSGKEVAVPKVVGKDMVFYKLTDFKQLAPGYFGIPEPSQGEIVHWDQALMIMPGVAFDRKNNRVGYGGGFYDRFLERIRIS